MLPNGKLIIFNKLFYINNNNTTSLIHTAIPSKVIYGSYTGNASYEGSQTIDIGVSMIAIFFGGTYLLGANRNIGTDDRTVYSTTNTTFTAYQNLTYSIRQNTNGEQYDYIVWY